MEHHFTLEYWIDDNWYVGKLKEIPGIFSQGETIEELEENIKDVYSMMLEEQDPPFINQQVNTKDLVVTF